MSKINKQAVLAILASQITTQPILLGDKSEIFIKKLTVGEQNTLVKLNNDKEKDAVDTSLLMVAFSLCDEKGNRLFDDNDIDELKQMDSATLNILADNINKLNGFDKSIDDIKKN